MFHLPQILLRHEEGQCSGYHRIPSDEVTAFIVPGNAFWYHKCSRILSTATWWRNICLHWHHLRPKRQKLLWELRRGSNISAVLLKRLLLLPLTKTHLTFFVFDLIKHALICSIKNLNDESKNKHDSTVKYFTISHPLHLCNKNSI